MLMTIKIHVLVSPKKQSDICVYVCVCVLLQGVYGVIYIPNCRQGGKKKLQKIHKSEQQNRQAN